MKKYFYSDGTNSFGPFSIQELREKGITTETSVWFHELGEWKKAGTIPELSYLFSFNQPPLPYYANPNQSFNIQNSRGNNIDIFVFIAIVYWFLVNLVNFIIEKAVDDWWSNDTISYIKIGMNIFYAAIPIIFAISINNKILKIIAVILSALYSIYILYSNIDWLMSL
jgi:GYF domain 2